MFKFAIYGGYCASLALIVLIFGIVGLAWLIAAAILALAFLILFGDRISSP